MQLAVSGVVVPTDAILSEVFDDPCGGLVSGLMVLL